jgi:hypothetical protein
MEFWILAVSFSVAVALILLNLTPLGLSEYVVEPI